VGVNTVVIDSCLEPSRCNLERRATEGQRRAPCRLSVRSRNLRPGPGPGPGPWRAVRLGFKKQTMATEGANRLANVQAVGRGLRRAGRDRPPLRKAHGRLARSCHQPLQPGALGARSARRALLACGYAERLARVRAPDASKSHPLHREAHGRLAIGPHQVLQPKAFGARPGVCAILVLARAEHRAGPLAAGAARSCLTSGDGAACNAGAAWPRAAAHVGMGMAEGGDAPPRRARSRQVPLDRAFRARRGPLVPSGVPQRLLPSGLDLVPRHRRTQRVLDLVPSAVIPGPAAKRSRALMRSRRTLRF